MEDWKAVVFWLALGFCLMAGAWSLVAAIRRERKAERLDREAYKERPLIPDDKVAVMRPGDTVLLLLPLADMTLDQQTGMVDSTKRMAERAGALGIEFIVLPDWGQKAIVVSRGALDEESEKVGAGGTAVCNYCGRPFAHALGETDACKCPGGLRYDEAERKKIAESLMQMWNEMRERDQAALAKLRCRAGKGKA